MAFVLRSSDGILKDGQRFTGTPPQPLTPQPIIQPPEDVTEKEVEDSPPPEPSSSTAPEIEIDDSSSGSEEIVNLDLEPRIKSEHDHVKILNAYSLESADLEQPDSENIAEDSVSPEVPVEDNVPSPEIPLPEVVQDVPSPEVHPTPDGVLEEAPPEDPEEPDSVQEPPSPEVPFSGNDRVSFEKIASTPDIKPDVDFRIQKKSDPKMGIYYSCPKCYQKYVSEDCVHEHLEYCTGFQTLDVPETVNPSQPNSEESADDSDEDPDFSPGDSYQRKVYYNCKFCPRRFDSLPGLRSHERLTHGHRLPKVVDPETVANPKPPKAPKPSRIFCGICNQKFSVQRSLRRHLYTIHSLSREAVHLWLEPGNLIETSANQKPGSNKGNGKDGTSPPPKRKKASPQPPENILYPCGRCSSNFTTKELLEDHELEHRLEVEKPYVCDFCDKSFFLRSYLEDHEKTHVNEYPYSCKVCGECYSRQKDLDSHCSSNPQCAKGNNKEVAVITCD